jgi:putative tryptophan/tyrosine transport system substrate-binding protein
MALTIGRRQFMSTLAGAAATWPLVAQAQQPLPVIGWLFGVSSEAGQPTLAAFRKTLGDAGYVEGRNVLFEYRWADGQYDRLPAMAADLVARPVTLIVTGGGEPAAFAAKAATSTIPIVMVGGSDPVKEGLVASLNRPGRNITGATVFSYDMESKRLGLLHEAAPAAKTIAALFNPANPAVELQLRDVRDAAPRIGIDVVTFTASAESEFEGAFAAMEQRRTAALLVGADPFAAPA